MRLSDITTDILATLDLTPRQQQVGALVAQGKKPRQIAKELNLSEMTVKVAVMAIYRAIGLFDDVQSSRSPNRSGKKG